MDGYSFLSSDEDSDSEWVNIHRLNKAVVDSALNSEENLLSSPTGQSTYPTTADSSREIIQPKQPSSEQSPAENSSQQTRSGRLWSSVPSFGVWVATAGVQGDQKSVDAGALDDTMATNQADEQKKPGWLKRKKLAAAEVMQRVKTTWKSEEETEDVLGQEEDDTILATVLKENTELQSKNTSLIKRLADQEKQCKSQLSRYKEEIRQLKQSKKPKTEPIRTEISDCEQKLLSLQQHQGNLQLISKERDGLIDEVSWLNQELMKLRESLDYVTHQNSGSEKRITELHEQAKHFETEYINEREDNESLRNEVKKLQRQFDSLLGINAGVAAESGSRKGQSTVCIGSLQERIKQLNEDIDKVKEHSKSQSHQIMRLRQQAEVVKDMEVQVCSMDILLREAEEERDQLRTKLVYYTAQGNESDLAEFHRGTVQPIHQSHQEVTVIELQRKLAQLTSEKKQLEESIPKDVRAVQTRISAKDAKIKDLTKSNQDLQSHLTTLQVQVATYKSDFEEERRDRVSVHSKMADMEKTLAQLKGRSGHERAGYQHEMGELERDNQVKQEELQRKHKELETVYGELTKYKAILADLEVVHQKHVQEASKEVNKWKVQAEAAQSELQAKASQMKQYAKENDKLKRENQRLDQQMSAAMTSMGVMAEEISKERRTTVKLRGKLDKTKGKEGKKGREVSLPDPCEAVEQQAVKLKELLDDATKELQELTSENQRLLEEVQSLTAVNDDLTDQVENIRRAQQHLAKVWEKDHGETISGAPSDVVEPKQFTCIKNRSDSQGNGECKSSDSEISSPLAQPAKADPDYKESRTTHLEKRFDEMQLAMQTMTAENEKLRDEVQHWMKKVNKQPGVAAIPSHNNEVTGSNFGMPASDKYFHVANNSPSQPHEGLLTKVDSQKRLREHSPLTLKSFNQEPPPTVQERSRSPSPVAVVKPIFQNPKPQSPYRRQASVGPIMVRALPSAQPLSPLLPHGHYYNQQQQQVNFMENVKTRQDSQIADNFPTMKHKLDLGDKEEEHDDRPFDPNLVCPNCKKQFRIGEIQEHKKHYETCLRQNKEDALQLDPAAVQQNIMAGDTQPFTPIFPSMEHRSEMSEVMPEPKLLCRTPGCSFKGYEELGGLCRECSDQLNI